jgi:phospholipase/carboxylesterase
MTRGEERRGAGQASGQGRLEARPAQPTGDAPVGLHTLGLDSERDGVIYVPAGYRPDHPMPLILMLHGANGSGRPGLLRLKELADEAGVVLVAPDSRGRTWDVLLGGYGPDVAFIDRALNQTLGRYAIDRSHLAMEGFSDGASYALSLGLMNGDLFSDIIAFSPGFVAPAGLQGRPRIFVSHGTLDAVLPIDSCGRMIASMLARADYDVSYHEFAGPHTVPPDIARDALSWFLGPPK